MKALHVATGVLALGIAACGYNNSYNNETAYNDDGAAYDSNATNYSEDVNYSAEESNYSANATANVSDMNATATNEVGNTATNY